ncbi:MAG TPA: AMP-binding protein, partial [Azospira sp.]|nr:AMP-binding protein [Azospira sp.]
MPESSPAPNLPPSQSTVANQERWPRLLAVIESLRAEVHPGAAGRVGRDSSLERDLGLDSLARGELLLRIEAAFGLRLPEGTLGRAETPGDLLQALARGTAWTQAALSLPREGMPLPPSLPVELHIELPIAATTLTQVLEWHAGHYPEREHIYFLAATDRSESLTYRGLLEAARQLGAGLIASGLAPGQTVAIMLPTSLDFFHAFFGTLLAGGVPVPLYPPANPARLADHLHRQAGILESCQAPLLVTLAEARPLARLVQAR